MSETCKSKVYREGCFGRSSCTRKVWSERPEDGYCKQHHPETVAVRYAERAARDKAWWAFRERNYAIRDAECKVLGAAEEQCRAMTVDAQNEADRAFRRAVAAWLKLKEKNERR